MPARSTWKLGPTCTLTRRELATVLADLTSRAAHSAIAQRNLIIARMACCCGPCHPNYELGKACPVVGVCPVAGSIMAGQISSPAVSIVPD